MQTGKFRKGGGDRAGVGRGRSGGVTGVRQVTNILGYSFRYCSARSINHKKKTISDPIRKIQPLAQVSSISSPSIYLPLHFYKQSSQVPCLRRACVTAWGGKRGGGKFFFFFKELGLWNLNLINKKLNKKKLLWQKFINNPTQRCLTWSITWRAEKGRDFWVCICCYKPAIVPERQLLENLSHPAREFWCIFKRQTTKQYLK